MEINILSKTQIQTMIDKKIKQSETRMFRMLEKMRKKILELEDIVRGSK